MILGIIMTILFKFQVYLYVYSNDHQEKIFIGIAIEIIFLSLYAYRSFFLKRLIHGDDNASDEEAILPNISSLSELKDKQIIPGVYMNRVYDLREL
jgi:hypothetical protein